jgi:hypothetical protein
MLISDLHFPQAIAVHTFIMVWCNKGLNAIKAAWIAISIPWIYGVCYVTILRLMYRDESNVVFRPSPVCWLFLYTQLLTHWPVLVLDR